MANDEARRGLRREQDVELTTNSPEERGADDGLIRWGWVSARPSEYLIVFRGGKLAEGLCGQGARFFKWPSDTYAVVPTTLKEVVFQANQITIDMVDVQLRGMVLYRITDPLRIFRLINFTRREHAEAKLARMIADMCRSTSKWLVANMRLEECVRRRKEEIAAALKREVAAVATENWGIEITAIDIQDVFVQDQALFQAMQAAFKATKEQEATLAQLELEQSVAQRRLAGQRDLEQRQHALTLEKGQREAEAALAKLELGREQAERRFALEQAEEERRFSLEQERERRRFALEQEQEEQRIALERRRAEAEAAQARARQEQEALLARARTEEEVAREGLLAEGARERARLEQEALRIEHEEEARALRERLEAEGAAGPAALERMFLREGLPVLAQALANGLEGARLNVYAGDAGAGALPHLLGQLAQVVERRLEGLLGPGVEPAQGNGAGRRVAHPRG